MIFSNYDNRRIQVPISFIKQLKNLEVVTREKINIKVGCTTFSSEDIDELYKLIKD